MKHIYLNLKRFDIPREMGGVNSLAPLAEWAGTIVGACDKGLAKYRSQGIDFTIFFPEAHLLGAVQARSADSLLTIGSQGVYRDDTAKGGNFGAFTTNLTANAAVALGCGCTLIGHCEERKDKLELIELAGGHDANIVNRILNRSVRKALDAGLEVLYCIGERAEEQCDWKTVLKDQISLGLDGVDRSKVSIAYEPVWAIGPGKTPPDRSYIKMVGDFVKEVSGGLDLVYGGGLRTANAEMLASIDVIDGGLIALTRFSGGIGFYPDEYLEIVSRYFGNGTGDYHGNLEDSI
jgi:triosephosphate isomerase